MIERLKLANVGPAQEMELEFAPRLNVFTGDNGLGKSFILDIAWWSLTRTWPAEIGHKLTTGLKAFPYSDRKNEAAIEALLLDDSQKKFGFASKYNHHIQGWDSKWEPQSWKIKNPGDPKRPGLAIYVMSDGSFAVQDYHRNPIYWPWQIPKKAEEQGPFAAMKDLATMTSATAFVFNAHEVWNGLDAGDISGERWILCNGLIRDWAGWQKERGEPFEYLKSVLKELSPPNHPPIVPGKLTRVSLGDVRDMPTVKMPYGQEIALVHASSGLKHILALAYLLVWTWHEHKIAAELRGEETASSITFLIDEIESHMHPSWQRKIVGSMLKVAKILNEDIDVQIIATTHAPLVMASIEPLFDDRQDAWFDLDLEDSEVVLSRREFEKQGDANNWLTSEAFDLSSPVSEEAQIVIKEARMLLDKKDTATADEVWAVHKKLAKTLPYDSDFLSTWRYFWKKQGYMQ